MSLKHDLKDEDYVFRCILNRDENSSLTFNVAFSADANLDVIEQSQQMKKDQKGLKQVLNEIAPLSLGDALKVLMKYPPKTTVEQLAESSGLSDKTIQRMRNGEAVLFYQLSQCVLVCTFILILEQKCFKSSDGADVKIMDRFFRHREVPDFENFSKPGIQLKTA